MMTSAELKPAALVDVVMVASHTCSLVEGAAQVYGRLEKMLFTLTGTGKIININHQLSINYQKYIIFHV